MPVFRRACSMWAPGRVRIGTGPCCQRIWSVGRLAWNLAAAKFFCLIFRKCRQDKTNRLANSIPLPHHHIFRVSPPGGDSCCCSACGQPASEDLCCWSERATTGPLDHGPSDHGPSDHGPSSHLCLECTSPRMRSVFALVSDAP